MRIAALVPLTLAFAMSCQAPVSRPATAPAAAPEAASPAPAPAASSSAAAATAAPAAQGEPVPLGRLPDDVRPTHESLALTIAPTAERFGGTAEIALHLSRPRTVIWLHGRGLSVREATLAPAGGAAMPVRWDEVDPTGVVRVTVPSAVSGDVVLRVVYDAAYDPQLVGVYKVETSAGPAVFSKFEAIYARRAFPCFDEPAFKVPYDVALTVPGDTAAAAVVGNMPIASDQATDSGGRTVRFATTPPLPSYLVAFAVGPFETRSTQLPPTAQRPALPISAVALRGRGKDTAFALVEEPALLAEQERYFGLRFPFPKLDLVAVPDFQSGAMENAGAITFRDSALLVDDKITSVSQRFGVTSVLAHETAHQWFGDLVTMPWWNDIWLNEGFATFLADRTLRMVRPKLEAEVAAAFNTDAVMDADSVASARRIRQPIETTHDITNAFDGITYEKGAAVLTMLEHFVGDEPFRKGLHEFLTAHAGGNATTDQLIDALARASGKDLAPLVSSFLDQPGVPAVAVQLRCEGGRGRIELAQSRWRPVGSNAPADGSWRIPLCMRTGVAGRVETVCTVLAEPTGSLELPGCPGWIMPNADAAGYYRATLSAGDLAHLAEHRGQLSVVERVQLGHDLEAGYRSAALSADDVLRGLEPLARDPHGAVALVPVRVLERIDRYVVDEADRKALRAHIGRLYAPAVASLGWDPAASDGTWRRRFRTVLLGFLALDVDDPPVLAEAARRGRRMLGLDRDHVKHPDAASPDLAGVALEAAARTGGSEAFDALLAELAHSEDAQLRQRLLSALGHARDPALVGRALDLALDPRLRKNERLVALRPLLDTIETRDVAWAWLEAHFDALAPLLPDRYAGQIPGIVGICDAARAERVRAFFAPRADRYTGAPRNLATSLEVAAQCSAQADAQRGNVKRYVAALAARR